MTVQPTLLAAPDATHDNHRTLADRFADAPRGFTVLVGEHVWQKGYTWMRVDPSRKPRVQETIRRG